LVREKKSKHKGESGIISRNTGGTACGLMEGQGKRLMSGQKDERKPNGNKKTGGGSQVIFDNLELKNTKTKGGKRPPKRSEHEGKGKKNDQMEGEIYRSTLQLKTVLARPNGGGPTKAEKNRAGERDTSK